MIVKGPKRMALLACASVAALSLVAGASPAAAKTKTVHKTFAQCQNLGLSLAAATDTPSPPPGSSPIRQVFFNVPKTPKSSKPRGGKLTGATVGVRITHTFDGDVDIFLISPTGRFVPLVGGRGGSGDDFGSGATDCNGTLTTFSDLAPIAIGDGTPPYAGAFKPESSLAALNGGTASGVWTVVVTDTVGNDDGTIHAVSLNLTYQYKKPKK
jgi:hypothetical protein